LAAQACNPTHWPVWLTSTLFFACPALPVRADWRGKKYYTNNSTANISPATLLKAALNFEPFSYYRRL